MAEHQINTVIIYRSTRRRSRVSGHSCLYARISELLEKGTDTHLVQVFRNKKRLWRRFSKLSSGRVERLDGWLADVIEHFAYLWEASQEDNRWTMFGSLHLGVLKTAKGNSRRIAGYHMRQMIIEARNGAGRGLRTPRQLLVGMVAGEKKRPSVRLSLKQRKALNVNGGKHRRPQREQASYSHNHVQVRALRVV